MTLAQEGDQGAAGRAREMGGLLLRSHGVPTSADALTLSRDIAQPRRGPLTGPAAACRE